MPWLLLALGAAVIVVMIRARGGRGAGGGAPGPSGTDWTTTGVFQLARNAYRSLGEWAADRGVQIRQAFGLAPDPLRPYTRSGPKPSEMSADEWNARKIATLAPIARPRFAAFLVAAQRVARAHGTELLIWWAVRPLESQTALYQQGRTTPGDIVTRTIASNHLWGLAVDLTFRSPSGEVLFRGPGGTGYPPWYYREVLPLAATHGLQSLYLARAVDAPHIEMVEGAGERVASASRQLQADFPGVA